MNNNILLSIYGRKILGFHVNVNKIDESVDHTKFTKMVKFHSMQFVKKRKIIKIQIPVLNLTIVKKSLLMRHQTKILQFIPHSFFSKVNKSISIQTG